jgi:tRNA G18 (ribose-2'-O)-methylase SpoU
VKAIRKKTAVRSLNKQAKRTFHSGVSLAFWLQDWEDGYNVGGLYRVADACGATLIVMTGRTPKPGENPMIGVTSLGHHRRIRTLTPDSNDEAIALLKGEGWSVVGVEVADGAVPLREYAFPDKTCLVLGNEGAGIYDSIMKQMDGSVYIPQFGKGRSMNVVTAAAVVAFQAALIDPEPQE